MVQNAFISYVAAVLLYGLECRSTIEDRRTEKENVFVTTVMTIKE